MSPQDPRRGPVWFLLEPHCDLTILIEVLEVELTAFVQLPKGWTIDKDEIFEAWLENSMFHHGRVVVTNMTIGKLIIIARRSR